MVSATGVPVPAILLIQVQLFMRPHGQNQVNFICVLDKTIKSEYTNHQLILSQKPSPSVLLRFGQVISWMMGVLLQLVLMIIRFIYSKQPQVVVEHLHHQLRPVSSPRLIFLDVRYV